MGSFCSHWPVLLIDDNHLPPLFSSLMRVRTSSKLTVLVFRIVFLFGVLFLPDACTSAIPPQRSVTAFGALKTHNDKIAPASRQRTIMMGSANTPAKAQPIGGGIRLR